MKHILLIGILLVSTVIPSISQKVKYKNLFVLLAAENYQDADRYLRSFLKENPEHPHANYAMGKMLQSYLGEQDVLKNSARIIEIADSALTYLNKGLSLTTEKYVKKHNENYYAEWKRRDMRTAKFTVKLSDFQLDVESRVDAVNKIKNDVAELSVHFDLAVSLYDSTLHYYDILKSKAGSINVLYFNSGLDELLVFRRLAARYDSCLSNFRTFQVLLKELNKNSVRQKIVEKTIESYPVEISSKPDFHAETVEFLNFKEWSKKTEDIILKQVYPLKKRMITFDKTLKDLHDEVIGDSLDARSQIFKLATGNVARDIMEFDDPSLPAAIYNYRIAEVNYHSAINYWYKVVADTLNIGLKLDVIKDLINQHTGNARLLETLILMNNAEEKLIFKEFIKERYLDDAGIQKLVDEQTDDVQKYSALLLSWLDEAEARDKFTQWHNERIALEAGGHSGSIDTVKFSTILTNSFSAREIAFYAWRQQSDSLSLCFSIAPSSRYQDTLYMVSIDSRILADKDVINMPYISDSLSTAERVWVFNTTKPDADSVYVVQVISTHLTEGVRWSKSFMVKDVPTGIKFDKMSKSLTIVGRREQEILILDNGGEVLQDEEPGEESPEN
jgi:hypothetical protein